MNPRPCAALNPTIALCLHAWPLVGRVAGSLDHVGNPSLQSILRKHRLKHLLEAKRTPKGLDKISGFVIDLSLTFGGLLLVHRLEWDTFRLNGYSVLRMESMSFEL